MPRPLLKSWKSPSGHLVVSVYGDNGHKYHVGVHRLVTMAFHGVPPLHDMVACHKNDVPDDNVPDNLRWGSRKENYEDAQKHGRRPLKRKGMGTGRNENVEKAWKDDLDALKRARKANKDKMNQRLMKIGEAS